MRVFIDEELSINVAEAIPYRNFKNKIDIVKQELNKDRYVEIIDELKIVYSADKRRWENEENQMQKMW